MYQMSMFERATTGAGYIASGVNGKVYDLGNGWVFKRARRRDSTLNWLEWCKAKHDAGEYMRGMPIIERLTHTEEGYICTMQKMQSGRVKWRDLTHCLDEERSPQLGYMRDLIYAYCSYYADYISEWDHGPYDVFSDLHSGNVMVNKQGDFVIIDPSNEEYCVPQARGELILQ